MKSKLIGIILMYLFMFTFAYAYHNSGQYIQNDGVLGVVEPDKFAKFGYNTGWQEIGRDKIVNNGWTHAPAYVLSNGTIIVNARDMLNQSSTVSANKDLTIYTLSIIF